MSIEKSIASKLNNRIQERVGHRVDMTIADFYKMSPTSARFMIEYSNNKPSSEDLTNYFIRNYDGKIFPDLTTAKYVPAEKVIIVVASMVNYNKPIEEASKMKKVIAGYTYFDEILQETWEAKEVDGTKVLSRRIKEDIASIVESRRKVMMDKTISRKTFASIKSTASIVKEVSMVDVGDIVTAYSNGRQYNGCEVLKVLPNQIEAKYKDKSMKFDRLSVLEVVAKAEEMIVKDEEKLVEYFTKAYGDEEYAKKLVKK